MSRTATETVSVLMTDLVGSTVMADRLGPAAADELRAEHFGLLRGVLQRTGGREVKNLGDGLMVVFQSASQALTCAVEMQQAVEARNRRAAERLEVRIGVSLGDTTVEDGDYFGEPVVESSRLCAQATGGQIVIDAHVRHIGGARDGHRFHFLGELELKGISEPVQAFELQWEPALATGIALPERLRELPATAYVGRVAERTRLTDLWGEACEGSLRLALISGEPGMGKTRLATHLALQAHAEGATVLYGRCDEDLPVPYQPWTQALGHFVKEAPQLLLDAHVERHGGEMARLVPALGDRVPELPAPRESDPETERYLLYAAAAGLLEEAGEQEPLLLILDDLHCADGQTLSLLRHVVTAGTSMRVLLVGTYRDSELPRDHPLAALLADLHREQGVQRIRLSGLQAEEVMALMEALAGHELDEDGRELAREITRETAGNPFFAGELLRHLMESGTIMQEDGVRWRLVRDVAELGLPQSVREVIGRRVERLDPDARTVLSAAAVIGVNFRAGTLSRAAGFPPGKVLELLDQAAQVGLVRPLTESADGYAFSHGLVLATLDEALPRGRRCALHAAVGEALEQDYDIEAGEGIAEVAHHFLEAAPGGNGEKAVAYARRAAERAVQMFAYDQAVTLYTRALAIVDTGRRQERVALLQALGEAQMRSGDTDAARGTLKRAAAAARASDDPEALGRAALACGIWGLSPGIDEPLVRISEEAVEQLEGRDSPGLLACVKGQLAVALYWCAEAQRRERLAADALALARAAHERVASGESARVLAYVLGRYLLTRWGPDSAREDFGLSDELLDLCHQTRDGELEIMIRNWRVWVLLEMGSFGAVDQEIARVEEMATELRQPRAMVFLPLHHGCRAATAGRFADAERLNAESLDIGRRVPGTVGELAAMAQLVSIRLQQGRLAELEGAIGTIANTHPGMIAFQCVRALALLQSGRRSEARAELERLTSAGLRGCPKDNTHIVMLAVLAEVAAELEDQRRARELHSWLEPYAGRWVVSPGAAALWPVDRSLGCLALVGGLPEEVALGHIVSAREQAARVGAVPSIALAALDEARLLAASGRADDQARARSLAGEARELAEDLGMALVADAAMRIGR